MKIFLTGASGFLGSHIAEELVRQGHQVKALIRKTSRIDSLKSLPIEWIEGSLPPIQNLRGALESCDAVIHVAGLIKALTDKEFFEVNAFGTERLVDEVLKTKNQPKTFIYISSIAVHNASKDNSHFCVPSSECRPLSTYGKSKLAGERALEKLKGKVRFHILRPPILYGPRDRELLLLFKGIRTGIVPIFGLGNRSLSFCYGPDVAQAVANLVQSNLPSDEIFCLDDGESYTWKKTVQILSDVAQKKTIALPIPPTLFLLATYTFETVAKISKKPSILTLGKFQEMSQPHWVCGYQRLSEKIGWKPKVNLREGAKQTLFYYQNAGWLKR